MSVKVLSLVWEGSRADGSALLVLLALADWADDSGNSIYPSIATIAKKTRMSIRNVQYSMRVLADLGELTIGFKEHKAYGTNTYSINVKALRGAKFAPVQTLHGATGCTGVVQGLAPGVVQPVAPNPSVDPSGYPSVGERAPHPIPANATVAPAPTHPPPPSISAPDELRTQPKPPTRKQAARTDEEQKREPAVLAYAQVFRQQPNPAQRAAILREVTDPVKWGGVCQQWALKGYKAGNVEGMLEVYRDGWRIAVKDWPGAGKASRNGKTFIRPQVADSTPDEIEQARIEARKRIAEREARKAQ